MAEHRRAGEAGYTWDGEDATFQISASDLGKNPGVREEGSGGFNRYGDPCMKGGGGGTFWRVVYQRRPKNAKKIKHCLKRNQLQRKSPRPRRIHYSSTWENHRGGVGP